MRGTWAIAGGLALSACAGQGQIAVGTTMPTAGAGSSAPAAAAKPPLAIATPVVQIDEASTAIVNGQQVPFDGVAEGLEWPALAKAITAPRPSPLVVQIARTVPTATVLRAIFTLRASAVHLQAKDDHGAMAAVELLPKPATPPTGPKQCHLAAFLKPTGEVRVASPGGPQEYATADAFAHALDAARIECPLRYVAFGAQSGEQPFGGVFDVMLAVDRIGAAGGARYVLADAVPPPKRNP
jgi:hypothetical protein